MGGLCAALLHNTVNKWLETADHHLPDPGSAARLQRLLHPVPPDGHLYV